MAWSGRKSDAVLALFVVAIAAMLVVPLPTALLDLLLVVNLSFSVLLLLVGLYMPNALALLSFPSILLLTTLFRLGLNVASARLILSIGEAGSVIQAFGTFLVRGEVVVGIIIFCIITIVNFIVIARGASRVSEVAARFALDALPGKQMSIDADLRSGILSSEEARIRRDDLRKESQLYGSMDGAMKFVQGDAVAGFFIIFTNIVGGMYMGIRNGLSFGDAIQTYTVLTVGDGLVNQIPAILISICAGIVVTRVSSGDNSTLGMDVGSQLFASPATVGVSAMIILLIGSLPGLPKLPFFTIGLLMLGTAYFLHRARARYAPATGAPLRIDFVGSPAVSMLGSGAVEEEADDEAPLVIGLDASVLYKLFKQNQPRYTSWWNEFRNDFQAETGLRLPELRVVAREFAQPASYSIVVSGSEVATSTVLLDHVLVEMNPEVAEAFGLRVSEETAHPLNQQRVFWAPQSASLRRIVDAGAIRSYDFFEYLALRTAAFFSAHPDDLVTLSEVHAAIKQLEKRYPGLVSEVFSRNFIGLPRLTELLQELVRNGISIRDFKQIVESVAAYCAANNISAEGGDEVDLQDLVAYVRQSRRRQLIDGGLSARRTLKVIAAASDVEALLENAELPGRNDMLSLDPADTDRLISSLQTLTDPVLSRGLAPISLLCSESIRHKVVVLLRAMGSPLRVVTFNELGTGVELEQVGVWSAG